jgi:hypothetical protein
VANPNFAAVLREMRMKELQWISQNRDRGLEDFDMRKPEVGLGAERARAGIKANEPILWERLEKGELMKTQEWMKKHKKWPLK